MVYQRVKRTNILTNLNEQNPRLLTVFLQKKRTYFWHISKSKHGHIQYSCSLSPMSASISMGYICNWFEMQNLKSKSKKISNRKCARALRPEKKGHIFGTLAKENMDTFMFTESIVGKPTEWQAWKVILREGSLWFCDSHKAVRSLYTYSLCQESPNFVQKMIMPPHQLLG